MNRKKLILVAFLWSVFADHVAAHNRDESRGAPAERLGKTHFIPRVARAWSLRSGLLMAQPLSSESWTDLLSFRPSHRIQELLIARGMSGTPWTVHRLESGFGPVNLDYYGIQVTTSPIVNGRRLTPEQTLEYFRSHLDEFLDRAKAEVRPLSPVDEERWESSDPTGAVLSFTLKIRPFGEGPGILNTFEKGSVVVSDRDATKWRFTTIYTGTDFAHPVSGTREFGISKQANGSFLVYTRAADRATEAMLDYIGGELVLGSLKRFLQRLNLKSFAEAIPVLFDEGDKIWRHFQIAVKSFINSNGGKAEVQQPVVNRPDWLTVQEAYKPTVPWLFGYAAIGLNRKGALKMEAVAIGSSGQIVGTYTRQNKIVAFLWNDEDQDGLPTDAEFIELGTEGDEPAPAAVNADGIVVGALVTVEGSEWPVLWEPSGEVHRLMIPGIQGGRLSGVTGNVYVGTGSFASEDPDFTVKDRAFLWVDADNDFTVNEEVVFLSPTGAVNAEAVAVNAAGDVAVNGWIRDAAGELVRRAYRWRSGQMVQLAAPDVDESVAWGINGKGDVVGYLNLKNGSVAGAVWKSNTLTVLDSFGGKRSLAYGINEIGTVVGMAQDRAGRFRAALWPHGPRPEDLTMDVQRNGVVTVLVARAIDDRGRILVGMEANGAREDAILYPVP